MWNKFDEFDELQLIYTKIGSGANRSLGNKFIKSNLDFNILNKNKINNAN